jgi:hypothetical protein
MSLFHSVTAALIVRNEGRFIGDCLASLERSVDDIVVVDTGSSDDTVLIARDFGARVFHYDWTDDFAAARNFSLEACKTDWALYIDADERLAPPSRFPLRKILSDQWLAADVLFQPKANYTRYRLTRFLRVDPRIRFTGAIHETILPSLEAASRDNASAIGLTTVEIDHLGYDGDLAAKHARNLPLLEKCVAANPQRVFYWFHLTETLLGLGSYEAAYIAARNGILAAEQSASEKNWVDAAMICQMIAAAMLDRGEDPLSLLQRGLGLHPGNFGLRLTLARRELQFGNPSSSLEIGRSLRAINPDSLVPSLIAYDRNIFGCHSVEMQIASLIKLRRLREAGELVAANATLLSQSAGVPTRRSN